MCPNSETSAQGLWRLPALPSALRRFPRCLIRNVLYGPEFPPPPGASSSSCPSETWRAKLGSLTLIGHGDPDFQPLFYVTFRLMERPMSKSDVYREWYRIIRLYSALFLPLTCFPPHSTSLDRSALVAQRTSVRRALSSPRPCRGFPPPFAPP